MADIKQIEFAIKGNDLATKPLSEIGEAITKLTASLAEIVPASEKGEKNLSELTAVAGELKTALKGLAADQAIIDQFTSLTAQIGETDGKLQGLRAGADAAKLALANAVAPTAALRKEAQTAATAANAQAKALASQVARLEKLKLTASSAGVDLNQLAASQSKVDSAFNAAAPALARTNAALAAYSLNQKKAAAAAREHAEAEKVAAEKIEAAHRAMELFTGEAPSLMRTFREWRQGLVGLALAYVSVEGAIEQVKGAYEDLEKLEGARSQLKSSFGEDAGKQMAYVRDEADKLGKGYIELTVNYAKFASAAKANNVSLSNTRSIFETFAEAAKVKKLSDEQVETMFGALTKIMAKDSVGASDVFRKLTAELPDFAGAIRASFGTGDLTGEQFDKILKSGKLTGDMLVGLAASYRETFAEQLPESTADAGAAIARFQNAFKNLKQQVIEGGALEVLTNALGNLTVYLKSDDGKKFGEKMGAALKTVAEGFAWLTEHLGVVKGALEGLAAVWIFRSAWGAYNDIKRIAEGFALLAGNVTLLKTELNLASLAALRLGAQLKLAAGVVGAGLAGWELGTWLYENVAGVRVAATAIIGSFDIMWETIKGKGKLAWTAIFDHSNYAAQAAEFDKAQLKRIADFREQMRSAGRDEDGAALPASGVAGDAGAGKPHTESAADAAARTKAEILVQMGLIDDAAKGVSNHLSGLRAELAKHNATELQAFIIGLDMQLKPVRDEIAKLSTEYGKNADATVAKLRAGLAAYRADAIKQQGDTFSEHAVKDSKQEIENAIRLRDILIHNEEIKKTGGQSPEKTQANIGAISAKANADIGPRITALIAEIGKLKPDVQKKLEQTTAELQGMLAALVDKPAADRVKEMTAPAEELIRLLDLRAAKLGEIKQLEVAGALSKGDALEKEKQIAAEYASVIKGALAYAQVLRTSKDLTADELTQLESMANKLEIAGRKATAVPDALYTEVQVNNDIAAGMTKVGAAFAKHLGQAHGLKGAFQAAGAAFKQFASDFLLKIGEMILQKTILNALEGTAGTGAVSAGNTGSWGGIISAGVAALTASHMGGMAGAGVPRQIHAAYFNNAPRMHSGGMAGLGPNEIPAILQRGEEVLARNDARNAMNGGKTSTPQHIQVVNAIDHESVVRQGLQAPSNTKVVLNMIRANRQSIKSALA
jgi:hypothetical protein